MRKIAPLLILTATLGRGTSLAALPIVAPPGSLAIVHGLVIDGTGAAPIEDGALVVLGERVFAVAPAADLDLRSCARMASHGVALVPAPDQSIGQIEHH